MTDQVVENKPKTATEAFPAAAGAATIGAGLAFLLADLNVKRELAMAIENFTEDTLDSSKLYIESGKVIDFPVEINAGMADAVTAAKTSGAATGAVGVICYNIGDTGQKLAVLWSVPFDYNLYQNLFNFSIVDADKNVDKNLYQELYKGAAKATGGELKVTSKGYEVKGTMGTGGQAALDIKLRTVNG